MKEKMKKHYIDKLPHDINKWPIPACLSIGIGIGFLFVNKFSTAIPAFTLIGLGVGILISFLTSRKKRAKIKL